MVSLPQVLQDTVGGRTPKQPPEMYQTLQIYGRFSISTGAKFLNHQQYDCLVLFLWWLFVFYTMVNHHVAPPFGRICLDFWNKSKDWAAKETEDYPNPETNNSLLKIEPKPKKKPIWTNPQCFGCELLVSGCYRFTIPTLSRSPSKNPLRGVS